MKKIFFLLAVAILFSCGGNTKSTDAQIMEETESTDTQTTGKIKSTDVQIVNNEIVYDGTPYSGEVWTKDGKSAVIEVSDGRIIKITYLHKSGNPAAIGTLSVNEGGAKRIRFKYYDINGNDLTEHEWETKYEEHFKEVDIEEEFPLNVAN